jgi:YHS domain-containing protein
MEKDPVCGMDVDPNGAAGLSEYEGRTSPRVLTRQH